MAAAEHPLARALCGLCVCLGRTPAVPRTPADCAELLQALVAWAAPGPEAGSEKKVTVRAAAAVKACLLLLEAVRAASRGGGHVTSAGAAKAERAHEPENARESGKSGGPFLLLEGDVAPRGGGDPNAPEEGWEAPVLEERGGRATLSLEEADGAPTSAEKTDVALDSPKNSEGTAPLGENEDGAPHSLECDYIIDDIIDPRRVLRCTTAPLLLLCGAHIPDTAWSDAQSRCLARQLLRSLMEVSHVASVADLLRGDQEPPFSAYKEALQLLGPQLRK